MKKKSFAVYASESLPDTLEPAYIAFVDSDFEVKSDRSVVDEDGEVVAQLDKYAHIFKNLEECESFIEERSLEGIVHPDPIVLVENKKNTQIESTMRRYVQFISKIVQMADSTRSYDTYEDLKSILSSIKVNGAAEIAYQKKSMRRRKINGLANELEELLYSSGHTEAMDYIKDIKKSLEDV